MHEFWSYRCRQRKYRRTPLVLYVEFCVALKDIEYFAYVLAI